MKSANFSFNSSSTTVRSEDLGNKSFKRNRVRPSAPSNFTKFVKYKKKNLKKIESRSKPEDRVKYGLQRSTKLFIEITNGKSVRKSRSPSPRRAVTPEEQDDEGTKPGSPAVKKNTEEVVEITPIQEEGVTIESVPTVDSERNKTKTDQIFDRLSEKASKFLPSKKKLGKLFGDKDSDIAIYTIDKEMAKAKSEKPKLYETETFHNSELTDKLEKTKQNIQIGESPRFKSVGSLANPYPPYRLYFLPTNDWKESHSFIATMYRVMFCQCTLASFLTIWLIFGALTFYLTEGPYEYAKIYEIEVKENSLILSLATDLRLLNPEEPVWKNTIEKYTSLHKNIILERIAYSYELQEIFWTFPGSILFATSLLTTFGLATPLPMSTLGSVEAFIFTLFGFPIHFIFLIHLGRTIAVKTQVLAKEIENKMSDLRRRIINVRRFGEDIRGDKEIWPDKMFLTDLNPPTWLKMFPIVTTCAYYIFGLLVFGVAREMEFPRVMLFPLDFSRCDVTTSGLSRLGYAWYLEGAAMLTCVNAAIWRDSPFGGLTPTGIKYGFMTNSLD